MIIEKVVFCDPECKSAFNKYIGDDFDPEAAFSEIDKENEGSLVFATMMEWLLNKHIEKELTKIKEEKAEDDEEGNLE